MKYSDVGVIAVMYAICAFFLLMTLKLPTEARTYPLSLVAGLGLLNTLYLGRSLLHLRGAGLLNDLPEIFQGFLAKQFFPVLAACVAYLALVRFIGFYLASALYLVGVMLFLKVPKTHLLLTLAVLSGIVYGVFTLFLKVPLPKGILFQ